MTRGEAVVHAIRFDAPLDELVANLAPFPGGGAEPVAILHRADATSVLDRFIAGELSSATVSRWAFLLEGRDDIGFEQGADEVLSEVMFWLANPEINFPKGVLDVKSAKELRERINATPA